VFESIRRIYGAVQSATFFMKKNQNFLRKKIFVIENALVTIKNVEKSCDARFFGDKTILRIFLGFQKKVQKIGKNAFFSKKSLWSQDHFTKKSHYHLA
jgi:hypothetical protein